MVFLTQILGYAKRRVLRKHLRGAFIDSLRLHVRGGPGGMGFPRYGGVGGHGGNVYVVAKEGESLNSLSDRLESKKIFGGAGGNSTAKSILGVIGEDTSVEVPPGISVYDEHGRHLGDVNEDGSKLMVAKGGIGGCNETGYSGQKGDILTIVLDLKLIADVSLVGFPNAGKSTLLRAVSRASPKVASYPFTTIRPNLGIMEYKDCRQISIADLPGLIEGAHVNIGMGHKFLKHVERTKLLLFIVDIQGFQLSPQHNYRSCLETVVLLNKELELYKPDLLDMPAMLVINKMDTENAREIFKEIKPQIRDLPDIISQFPEEIRPDKVLSFDSVLPMAAAQRNKEEVAILKERIRCVLDMRAEQEQLKMQEEYPDHKLVKKIERETARQAPTLV